MTSGSDSGNPFPNSVGRYLEICSLDFLELGAVNFIPSSALVLDRSQMSSGIRLLGDKAKNNPKKPQRRVPVVVSQKCCCFHNLKVC